MRHLVNRAKNQQRREIDAALSVDLLYLGEGAVESDIDIASPNRIGEHF